MKILIHINSLGRGGAERVVSFLAPAFTKMGAEVTVATQWEAEDEYPLDQSVRRISVGLTKEEENKGRLYKAWTRLFRLRNVIGKEKPDIVLSFCNKANFRSVFALMGRKIPLLVSVRNDPKIDYAPYRFSTRMMEKKAAGCVFQTPDAKEFFAPKLQEKSRIIFNPISEQYVNITRFEGVRDREIVTVGRIAAQKNQLLLVKAFEQISDEFSEYVLKIYGGVQEEEKERELQRYIKEHHLENRVFLMGNETNVKAKIEKAALFVLPSDYEGMPNALIEAMALGLCCISTDCPCGGSAQLIENGKSGLLTPVGDEKKLADAMRTMLTDTELADRCGKEAMKVIDKVHPDRISAEWMDYIKSLVDDKR